jgi:hypothetical protein
MAYKEFGDSENDPVDVVALRLEAGRSLSCASGIFTRFPSDRYALSLDPRRLTSSGSIS